MGNDNSKANARGAYWVRFNNELSKGANEMACNSKCSSRKEAIYLLQELGFDTTILQGGPVGSNVALDDVVTVQHFKAQLPKLLRTNFYDKPCAIVVDTRQWFDNDRAKEE